VDVNASEQVNAIVDNLAEKIGVAAEKILPVTETMIQEMSTASFVGAIIFTIVSLAFASVSVFLYNRSTKWSRSNGCDVNVNYILSCVSAGIAAIIGLCSCPWFYDAMAPTMAVADKFLG